MTLTDQIYERARGLPETAAAEVLDFIGYLWLKLDRQRIDNTSIQSSDKWDVKRFLDCCAGSIPDFPDIEDEGPPQEREWLE